MRWDIVTLSLGCGIEPEQIEKVISGGVGYIFQTYLTLAIENATIVAERANQKGVWIIGSDSFFSVNKKPDIFNLPQNGITGFTFIGDKSEYREHGWYRTSRNDNFVRSVTGMEFDGEIVDSANGNDENLVILGFIYMPLPVAITFLSLHSQFPVAATTYLGADSNVKPLKLSLFFDFMLATCTTETDFISNRLGTKEKVSHNQEDRTNARKLIYEQFGNFNGFVAVLNVSGFEYKKFPCNERNYKTFLNYPARARLLLDSADVGRSIRTELSVQKVLKTNRESDFSNPTAILSALRGIISESDDAEIHLRMIFIASLALSIASNGKGGLRNGPAKNPCFPQMEEGKMQKYLLAMIDEICKNWVSDANKMIRAARHLESAAQNYIQKFVESMCLPNPITCLATKTNTPVLEVCQDDNTTQIKNEQELFYVHDKPTETGSIVCACILALNFHTLSDFFSNLNCIGLRVETRSNLPHGSGLGTSSTIASAILRAFSAFGVIQNTEKYSVDEMIVHTVLRVEQIMTTGGGWQDQVGSLYPGLKKCYFSKDKIAVQNIPLKKEVVELLEKRILLIYTGKTRLAKNLLQEVIRNFFTCPSTKNKLQRMTESVDEFVERIQKGELPVELIEQYHNTKNFMTRCEPPIVTKVLEDLKSDFEIWKVPRIPRRWNKWSNEDL
uniref:GHMP_kinases_N domain-containing protein n=1 Tax=Caenorhabditis japonica TaxID=281687 RepID=A0A8R1E746_CAEJA